MKERRNMKLHPDGIKVRGPNVDGGWTLTLSIGEYEKDKVAQLIPICEDVNEVTIETYRS